MNIDDSMDGGFSTDGHRRGPVRAAVSATVGSRLGYLAFALLFAVVTVGAVLPLWLVPFPPLQDLPQHLAAIRILHSYEDPSFGFAEYFQVDLFRTQYLAYYWVCHLLSYVWDVATANLLLISATLVAIPYALACLLRALGRDPAWALFVVPLTYNPHLILGFLNFLAAIPLMLWGLALAVWQQRAYRRWRAVLLGCILVVAFYTHVVPFALLAVGVGLLALGSNLHKTGVGLLPLVPVVPAAIHWLLVSPAGQATATAAGLANGRHPLGFRTWDRALGQLPVWLSDVFAGNHDLLVLKLWGTLLVGVGSVGLVFRCRRAPVDGLQRLQQRLWPLPFLAVVGYFYAPSAYDWIWPIAERFALLAAILVVCLLPRLERVQRTVALSLLVIVCGAHITVAQQALRGFSEEVGDIDGAIAAIPPKQRVVGLIFQRDSNHVRFSPFLHYVALYQARKGGVVMFSFAEFPQSPITFRPENRPPQVRPRWEWLPRTVNPRRDLGYYDYVLVRGGPGQIERQRRSFEEVFRSPHWRVYRNRRRVE